MNQLDAAIKLRNEDRPEEALVLLREILFQHPTDPLANYQAAWTCDYMGREREAAPFYEAAIANGLSGEDLRGAFLGLGSTYRCLGEYEKSLKIFDRGISEFSDDRSLKTFRALTLYNLGKSSESIRELLIQLAETSADENIKSYSKALTYYSDKLDQVWD